MVVTCHCSFWWKEDHGQTFTCQKMIAHYLFLLSLVNQSIFFCVACIFAKLTKIESDWGEHEQHPPLVKFRHFMFPIICWLWLKSKHDYTFNIWIQSILTMISPITYFYTLAKPGKFCHLTPCGVHVMFNKSYYFSGTLDKDFIRQWQRTLLIFNGILVIVNAMWHLLEFSPEDQDWTLSIINSISMAFIVVGLIKTYLKEFVNLDKI